MEWIVVAGTRGAVFGLLWSWWVVCVQRYWRLLVGVLQRVGVEA